MPLRFDDQDFAPATGLASLPRHALAESALTLSGVAAILFDGNGRVLWANRALLGMTGHTLAELRSDARNLFYLVQPGDTLLSVLFNGVTVHEGWEGDVSCQRSNGSIFPALLKLQALRGEADRYIGVLQDLSRTRTDQALIRQLRYYDTLTGLPNWAWLQNELSQLLNCAVSGSVRLAILLIDLNHFKAVNDAMGEAVGDYLIESLAERFQAAQEAGWLIARRDGDEFCIVLPWADAQRATHVAATLLSLVAEPIHLAQQQYTLSACAGISLYPEHGSEAGQLLGNAGTALHAAKRMAPGGVCLFNESLSAEAQARRRIEDGLQRALAQSEFHLCYQPQIRLSDGKVTGVEALLRWRLPDGKLMPPAQFIPVAEQTGQIVAIGAWVLEEACRQVRAWHDGGLTRLYLAVNLSPCQFRQGNLVQMVSAILARTGFPAEKLELEITEGVLMEDPERAETIISSLRAIGVNFAVDDFGTGYSSLAYLKRFPLQTLKIDRSFVLDCCSVHQDRAIIDSIIGLAGNLGLQVVAEGVENEAQQQFLTGQGCDLAQGYLFSPPVGERDCVEWIKQMQAGSST